MDRLGRAIAAGCAVGLVLVLGALRGSSSASAPSSDGEPRPKPALSDSDGAKGSASHPPNGPKEAWDAHPNASRALSGTEVDDRLRVTADGHLVVSSEVIALFDYFLLASGEESDEVIFERIAAHLREHLREPALGEALGLLDQYWAYRKEGRTVRIRSDATADERFRAVVELRRQHFGSEADALFGDDERAARAAIEKSRIASDPALSPEEKEDLLAAVEPQGSKAARSRATQVRDLRADEAALRADGAGDDVISRYRENKLGPEAAERLSALDAQRAAFKTRVEEFRAEAARCCGKSAEPEVCEKDVLARSFDERERIRVRAILGR